MGNPDLNAEDLVDRIAAQAARRGSAAPARPEALRFAGQQPLGQRPEIAFLNENSTLELVQSRGLLAGFRHRMKARIARPLLMVLRPFVATHIGLQNDVVNRLDMLVDRAEQLAAHINELSEQFHAETERLEERSKILHDLLEARVERLEENASERRLPPR
jgi:hypothetical protein